ncbi:putative uncharacterized protein [Clostridium sp. CAG:571]|jgi:hypothetical protein|nr:putative uncharacterized protein [Clostridium sp. CAG:571]HJJ07140.1 hypothetical protein [Clostridiaceae bacterium]
MIRSENIPNAYKEVYTILKYVSKDDVNLIPKNFIKMLKSKMNVNYKFEYNENLDLENQIILRETRAILGYIFLNFWANDIQKNAITKKLNEDKLVKAGEMRLRYQNQDIFKSRNIKNEEYKYDKKEKNNRINYSKKRKYIYTNNK